MQAWWLHFRNAIGKEARYAGIWDINAPTFFLHVVHALILWLCLASKPCHLCFCHSSKKTNLFSPARGEEELLGASAWCMNLLKPAWPSSAPFLCIPPAWSIPGPHQEFLENAASVYEVHSLLRWVKSVVINPVIHGCPVSKVWLLLPAFLLSLSLCVITLSLPQHLSTHLCHGSSFMCYGSL